MGVWWGRAWRLYEKDEEKTKQGKNKKEK